MPRIVTPGVPSIIVALVATVALAETIPRGAAWLTRAVWPALPWPAAARLGLPGLYVHHGFQLVLALIAIAAVRRLVPADYGLHAPRGRTLIPAALVWGVAFGVIMTVVDHARPLLAGRVPDPGYPLTAGNVWGWLVFEGVYVGPTEEIPFRALLVTFLGALLPWRLRLGGFDMRAAGVIVAALFAFAHAGNFATRPWPEALGQQIYAFALGVLYAYWLEKSGSVVAPALGHDAGDVTETAIVMAWAGIAASGA